MAHIMFKFDRPKAVEVILYLAGKVSEADVYGICKLLYLADKKSLEKYGRFIFGESYCAMQQGATPSNAYNLLKDARLTPIMGLRVDGNQVVALREAHLDYLSESDIECLNQIIREYGKKSNLARRQDAHDAAWKKAWDNKGDKRSVGIPVESIAELLPDSDDIIKYVSNFDSN